MCACMLVLVFEVVVIRKQYVVERLFPKGDAEVAQIIFSVENIET